MFAYKNPQALKAAIKRKGLHRMNYQAETVSGGWSARFFTLDAADAAEVRNRGFMAEVNAKKAAQ